LRPCYVWWVQRYAPSLMLFAPAHVNLVAERGPRCPKCTHEGIRQMIASRGGPEVLGFNGVLKRLYLTYVSRGNLIPLTHIHLQVRAPILYGIQKRVSSHDGWTSEAFLLWLSPILSAMRYLHTRQSSHRSNIIRL